MSELTEKVPARKWSFRLLVMYLMKIRRGQVGLRSSQGSEIKVST